MKNGIRLLLSFSLWSLFFDFLLLWTFPIIDFNVFLSFCWFCSLWVMVITSLVHSTIDSNKIISYYKDLFPILNNSNNIYLLDFCVHYIPFFVLSYFQLFNGIHPYSYWKGFMLFVIVIKIYFSITKDYLSIIYFPF